MAKYLTTQQYKRYDTGVSLNDVTDLALAMTINRAEASIDAHMGFDAKRGGFEPHQTMIQHRFEQGTLKTPFPAYPVPIRQVTRYRIQVSNLSTSGAGFFANISPADCVINNDGYYVEIVPLQAVTYSLSPVLIQLGLNPPIVEMDIECGFYIPTYGETLFDSGDHKTYYAMSGFWANTYTQALAAQPSLLPPIPANIYVNGSLVNASQYTINLADGSIVFNTAQGSAVVTADYTQTIPDYVTEACVYQVTHLLAIRTLNKVGLYDGLELARSGEQELRRPRKYPIAGRGRATDSDLCEQAQSCLARYDQWAIA